MINLSKLPELSSNHQVQDCLVQLSSVFFQVTEELSPDPRSTCLCTACSETPKEIMTFAQLLFQ
jgi:hypothetical protein